jgi:hypothetical protein
LFQAYLKNIYLVVVIKEIVLLSLATYCFLLRKKRPFYNQFWKGLLLMAVGLSSPVLGLLYPMPVWKLYLLGSPFWLAGVIIILLTRTK